MAIQEYVPNVPTVTYMGEFAKHNAQSDITEVSAFPVRPAYHPVMIAITRLIVHFAFLATSFT